MMRGKKDRHETCIVTYHDENVKTMHYLYWTLGWW